MRTSWIGLIVAALLICGPGPRGQELAARQASDLAHSLVPADRWNPYRGWTTVEPLPPPRSEGKPHIELVEPAPKAQWVEGDTYTLLWHWSGPIAKVRLYYEYERCKLGGRDRGRAGALISPMVDNKGYVKWTVPWMDAMGFWVRLAGYSAEGKRLAVCERYVQLRPREARDLHGTFIVVLRRHQRLYYFENDRLVRMHLVSTGRRGYATPRMQPGLKGWGTRMGKVFNKIRCAWSNKYDCPMPYWMAVTSSGMVGLHATTPSAYRRLGSVASHGCIRQHGKDARELFKLVKIGTPVYVF
ncbi:MAG: L,D-transpeptidase [Armatimonadetes bacterium]|nr:L,D-transpeptidase [Armatimonadota bacterium]